MTTEDEIRAKFHAGAEAWNRGDLAQYLSSYLDSDATRWVTGATVIRGKDAIAAAYRARFSSPDRMGKLDLAGVQVDFLGEADALVFGRLAHALGGVVRDSVFTVHLRRHQDDWFVVSDHVSAADA